MQRWHSTLEANFVLFAREAPQPTNDDSAAADAATDSLPPSERVNVSDEMFVVAL